MILKNKYNEVMDHVKVDAAMRERVLNAVLAEEAGQRTGQQAVREHEEQKKDFGELPVHKKEVRAPGGQDDRGGKKRLSFYSRMRNAAAAIAAVLALVLIGFGITLVTQRPANQMSMGSAGMADEAAADGAEENGGTTAHKAEMTVNKAEEVYEAEADEAAAAAADAAVSDEAAADAGSQMYVTGMLDLVGGSLSDNPDLEDAGMYHAGLPVRIGGLDGVLRLECKDDVIERVIWKESGGDVSFSELEAYITGELGITPEKNGDVNSGENPAAESEDAGSRLYNTCIWRADGKTVILRQDEAEVSVSIE